MPLVRLRGLSYAYEGRDPVLRDVDLHLEPGWTGLVGENGAGKSTLTRLILGELRPTTGEVRCDGLALRLDQGLALTAAVRAFAADPSGEARRWRDRLRLVPLDRWEVASPGEQRRWQLGAALASAADVLVLDEPSNHLDGEGRARLVDALRAFRGVGLLVSHDRALLDALTTTTVRVHAGEVRCYVGPYREARVAWEAEAAAAAAARDSAQQALRRATRQLGDARRGRAAAARQVSAGARMKDRHDADARSMGRTTLASWADKRLGRDVAGLRHEVDRRAAAVDAAAVDEALGREIGFTPRPGARRRLASLQGPLQVGDRVLSVDVVWDRDARVHLAGPNGAGKTKLLRALVAQAGDAAWFVPQQLDDPAGDLATLRALPRDERGRVLNGVAALGLDPARLLATPHPSPGEARKLRIALGLGRGTWGLVLDEPTHDLDLPAIERLEAALVGWTGALLLVTHDPALAQATTVATWTLPG